MRKAKRYRCKKQDQKEALLKTNIHEIDTKKKER
jgi:hypothetical protein